jgi:hypothetical protein
VPEGRAMPQPRAITEELMPQSEADYRLQIGHFSPGTAAHKCLRTPQWGQGPKLGPDRVASASRWAAGS